MATYNYRIHPSIGLARVGNSEEYYLGPETIAGMPIKGQTLKGGLPIKPSTDSTPITSEDLRDSAGMLKKQAARFKIYQYADNGAYSYPAAESTEIKLGSKIDGKTVTDIIWTVHVANKKANCWVIGDSDGEGLILYENGDLPNLRNPAFMGQRNPDNTERLKNLIIDAGPRAINAANPQSIVRFDKETEASYVQSGTTITPLPNYPKQFPFSDGNESDYSQFSERITTLGDIQTEAGTGRLVVTGGYGKACGFNQQGKVDKDAKMPHDVDNNNWIDDTSDGPVTAVIVLKDDNTGEITTINIIQPAWVVTTDPAYAPQTLNAVSLWDDVYTTWVEQMGLLPDLYNPQETNNGNHGYNPAYQPSFDDDVSPTFNAAHLQMWNTGLNPKAIKSHKMMANLTEKPPSQFKVLPYIRNPHLTGKLLEEQDAKPLMPFSLGDSGKSFLMVTATQYFMLQQWDAGKCVKLDQPRLTAGEELDRTILMNCLGGRFSPGIDLTFIVYDVNLFNSDWKNPAVGAVRINSETLNYSSAQADEPFLGVGYTPLRPDKVEPGDICKFMAIPWHADYNSCATHTPSPNPGGSITADNLYSGVNTTLYWSWPAQRPVSVYTYDDLKANNGVFYENNLPAIPQRFSVRGEGTKAVNVNNNVPGESYHNGMMNVGRFQNRLNMLTNWHKIGVIIQSEAIKDYNYVDKDIFLEVESNFNGDFSNAVKEWPNYVNDKVEPPLPYPKG